MDAVEVPRYRDNLFARRKKVRAVIEHLKQRGEEATGQRHFDWLDQAWDESDAHTADRLLEIYRRELTSIETALDRLEAGAYGSCHGCGRPIEPSRLDVFPQTEFCRACGEFRETFERAA